MANVEKTPKQLERHLKGLAHQKRIQILLLLGKKGNTGLTLDNIAEITKLHPKNISHHARKLELAGLVDKTFSNRQLVLLLSPYGKSLYKLITTFSLS